ncbi:hypothetical protein IMZ48_29290 [Candidatus Bathyarchaeota archaeon]|nr:hypothetical protein [Candidatus Bathyarchaeota archaeon]
MRELHAPEERMQLLSSGPAAATRRAVESFVEVVNGYENRIRVVFTGDFERAPGGYSVSPALPATCDAPNSQYAASWSEIFRTRRVLTRRET